MVFRDGEEGKLSGVCVEGMDADSGFGDCGIVKLAGEGVVFGEGLEHFNGCGVVVERE